MNNNLLEDKVKEALFEVMDPEIPTLSIVDLGIVTNIEASEDATHITLTPTFSGCPALKIMEDNKITALVVEDANHHPIGVLHMHDILRAGVM
jgi:metal-sulfur cluster biosynthetic enzyme